MSKRPYVHTTNVHNLIAPKEIVKEVLTYFSPKSVIDIGCGLGTFVKVFQEQGISAVGVDGDRVNKDLLYIDEKYFITKNLSTFHDFEKKFDLAVSLEVAEHIPANAAEKFIQTLISCADYILFSAAIPGQGGQNHINEQSPLYREQLFNKHGYEYVDAFRHLLRDNDKVFWWYKQNMFLVVKKGKEIPRGLTEKSPRYIIHPELYELKMETINNPFAYAKHLGYRCYLLIKKILCK